CYLCCLFILTGSVLSSHAASRLDWRSALVALTLTHHSAGAAWIGSIPYLLVVLRRPPDPDALARITGRFSTAAIIAVSLIGSPGDIAWSEYNHHYAGLVMLSIGAASLIARWFSPARHWPLLFLGLAFFLLVRADAENWPLGPRGFWESFQVAEVAQHRIFVL